MNSSRHSKDSLPPNFVRALRALFDILDTRRSGFIRYADIAERWSDNPPNVNGIPPNFLECLSRVTPPNGMLTFERFCSGLRLSLLESKQMKRNTKIGNFTPVYQERVQSDPNLLKSVQTSRNGPRPLGQKQSREQAKKIYSSQPAISQGHHSPQLKEENLYENYENIDRQRKIGSRFSKSPTHLPPPRYQPKAPAAPPPAYAGRRPPSTSGPAKVSPPIQQQVQQNGHSYRHAIPPNPPPGPTVGGLREGSHPTRVELPRERPVRSVDYEKSTVVPPAGPEETGSDKVRWRNRSSLTVVTDSRRHTVSEGVVVDSHISKHEKILMEEKDIVSRGLEVANRLKNWYNERLASLETRQKYVAKGMVPLDYAVHEQKMNYLRAHVTEVNRRMTSLMESSEKGFPSFVNYEHRTNIPQPADDQIMWMKKQNQSLTEEVSEKAAKILELEKDLSSLRRSYVHQRTEAARRSNSPALSSSRSSQSSPLANGHPPAYHVPERANGHPPTYHATDRIIGKSRLPAPPPTHRDIYTHRMTSPPGGNDMLATLI